jgi:DNA glycosylase AlkZ-like
VAEEVLSRRALNRATLDRQLLLRRSGLPVRDAVELLVGLQGQATLPPYYGLWSRIEGFDPNELGALLTDREAVRLTLLRGTVHLATVPDALLLRPLVQPVVERTHSGVFGGRMGGADIERLAARARAILEDGPLTARELGRKLVDEGIGDDVEAIGNAARVYLPLVQVPPRGVWGKSGQAKYTTLESWTGRELEARPSVEAVVLRYLAAFGPASPMDAQSWSELTKLREVFERLRTQFLAFRDEDGRELFDLPDAPRPGPEVPAPVRFLGEYDNVLLGYADRRRFIPEDFPWQAVQAEGRFVSNLLVDGILRATWRLERDGKRSATLIIRPHRKLAARDRSEVLEEGQRLIEFAAGEAATRDVRLEQPI